MYALIYALAIVLLVAADQITKYIVVSNMTLEQTIPAIKGLLDWTYILNDGASFGILGGMRWPLVAVTAVVMALLAFLLFSGRVKHPTGVVSFILIIAGGVGNMIDRVFNNGLVVDFIDIDQMFSFPKFNVADCCVTCGGVLVCVYILFFYGKKEDDKQLPDEPHAQGDGGSDEQA